MVERPDYVEYAFSAILVLGTAEDYLRDFAEHWDGLDLETFARALREGDRLDQQVAAFAIGYAESTWARDLLLPLLHSAYPEVRWAAALSLGDRREEAAFPVLVDMLQEFLPPNPPVVYEWYELEHPHIARLLGTWGKREAIKPLRDTLAKLWQVEQHPPADRSPQILWNYQDALVYALGQLGAFDALTNLNIPQERARFWKVTEVMGYLNAEHCFKKGVLQIVQGARFEKPLAEFLTLVSTLLQEKMGMSAEEADFAVKNYDSDYFDRWGPPLVTHSQCRSPV
jgi:hypothetical protein